MPATSQAELLEFLDQTGAIIEEIMEGAIDLRVLQWGHWFKASLALEAPLWAYEYQVLRSDKGILTFYRMDTLKWLIWPYDIRIDTPWISYPVYKQRESGGKVVSFIVPEKPTDMNNKSDSV